MNDRLCLTCTENCACNNFCPYTGKMLRPIPITLIRVIPIRVRAFINKVDKERTIQNAIEIFCTVIMAIILYRVLSLR